MSIDLTIPRTYVVAFTGDEVPPVVIPCVALDGLSRQRIEVAVEQHLTRHGMAPVALDVATAEGRAPTIAAISQQGVITGTLSASERLSGGPGQTAID